jgi:spermidine synthase
MALFKVTRDNLLKTAAECGIAISPIVLGAPKPTDILTASATVCRIVNPHMIALRKEFHVPDNDDRFEVMSANGALFIRNRQAAYDVLLIDGYDIHGLPAELTSQRFYDDCHAALGVDGIMVANLYYGHHDYQAQLDRIQRAFQGRILVVNDGEMRNSIVFACKGERLRKKGIGLIRRPKGLEAKAADHLLGAFARIATAQRYQWW